MSLLHCRRVESANLNVACYRSSFSASEYVLAFISIFSLEKRRERKWDAECEKWRELQQQLGKLRSTTSRTEAAKAERLDKYEQERGTPPDLGTGDKNKKMVALKYVLS